MIYFKGRLYVLANKQLREALLKQYHDAPAAGHQGIEKTLERIRRTYYFPGMAKLIKEYVLSCDSCFRNKTHRHKEYGRIGEIPTPTQKGQQITLDFITGLSDSTDPITNVNYDGILTVVDRLTKRTWFLPWKSQWDAKEFTLLFLQRIYPEVGAPEAIISDRDK